MIFKESEMSEEDIKLYYITPAIKDKWNGYIAMEKKITDGKISLHGNVVHREKPQKADYILYIDAQNPIAVIEAKSKKYSVSHGIQQAISYAQKLDIPFAYSSNGDAFTEHDFLTGSEREIPLSDFPTREELIARYQEGKKCSEAEEKIAAEPFYTSQTTYPPRYYQRIAINRVLAAIAKGQKRLLLVMATGTGKTYTAFQIVYRLLKANMKKKILYLADRNILVDQSIQQDFAPLEKTIHKLNFAKDDKTTVGAYEVYFALYQQMVGEDGQENFREWFPADFFDFIIVDECHRGSAKEESRWRKVLEYFKGAAQLGMTATPKETKYVSNIDYFGEPVYTYSLNQGIEDGFLAPFRVIKVTTNIADGWRPREGQRDVNGLLIEDRIYNNSDYDYNIIIQDRIDEVAAEITEYLKQTGRMQKTIVFCANEEHAERMRLALVNQNSDMVKENPDYVVRITGSDTYGKSKLDYFISVSAAYPVIATTSELLSTGADCKMTQLIVLDKMISSMTLFKQIIGRGTRVRWDDGKTHFTVMDFRNISDLFADPAWDGPVEQIPKPPPDPRVPPKKPPIPPTDPPEPPIPPEPLPEPKRIVTKDGCMVHIIYKTVSVYDPGGKLLKQEDIIDYTKRNIIEGYASLEDFLKKWRGEKRKAAIADTLKEVGIDLEALKAEKGMADTDDFDFICYVAYGKKPLTRRERANGVKKRDFFSKYSGDAQKVLDILLDKYMNTGIYEVENKSILTLPDFAEFGKPSRIAGLFGGNDGYEEALQALENYIYDYEGAD